MRFKVNIFDEYPEINIGVLYGTGLKVEKKDPRLEKTKAEALQVAHEKIGSQPVTKHPFVASWRELYRSFKTKPGDYRPSAEALIRRALKQHGLPVINTAVDAYNAVSVRHLIPMGGFDAEKVVGDIELRFSGGGEQFTPLGTSIQKETYTGEVVYADESRILTRRWNYRDCDETKITTETRNVIMFIDGSHEVPNESVSEALMELEKLLTENCGGVYETAVADNKNRVIEF
ncbi:MAG: phenylalanine--tRNA ligase beta subunit-related protein [Candidatus Bathyarchaeota archaeon]|nr:phenylalanine--tRNA ligase beta subunit-related protein [Candidatus Bathyarchaeota archaeon]